MSQTFHCPNCGAPLDLPDNAGTTVRCGFCTSSVIVPADLRRQALREPTMSANQAMTDLPDLAEAMREAVRLVKNGQKVAAVKLLQDRFHFTLQQASTAVDQIERGQVVQVGFESPLEMPVKVDMSGLGQAAKTAAKVTGGIGCLVSLLVVGFLVVLGGILYFSLSAGSSSTAGLQPQELFETAAPQLSLSTPTPAGPQASLSFGEEGIGPGLLDDPRSVGVDGEGNIVVANYSDGRVQRFDANGNFLNLWDMGDKTPLGALAAARDGEVFVAYGSDIHRFEGASGKALGLLPNPGNRFYDDVQVTADGGLVVLADSETILRMDREGQVLWTVEDAVSSISGDSELAARLAVDGLGNIYVLGRFNNAVFKFSPEGKFINRFGGEGEEPGQFRAPYALAVDGRGQVYVTDIKGIQVFDGDGRYMRTLDVEGVAMGLSFAPNGALVVVTNTPRVLRYDQP